MEGHAAEKERDADVELQEVEFALILNNIKSGPLEPRTAQERIRRGGYGQQARLKLITHLCRNRGELVLVAPGEKILNFLHTVYSLLGTLTGFRCFRSDIRSVEGGSSSSVFNGLCGWISCGHE